MSSDLRLHPSSLLFRVGGHARRLLLPGLLILFTTKFGWQAWAMVLFVPSAVLSFIHYLSFRYRYDPEEIVVRSGFLFRRERHIPYTRIQNIDASQNVLHRMIGVATVLVETGGGGEDPEARFEVLTLAALDEMRRRVSEERQRRGVASPEQLATDVSDTAAPGPQTVLRLSPADLLRCGLVENRGLVVLGAFWGIAWELGLLDDIGSRIFGEETTGRGITREVVGALFGLARPSLRKVGLTLLGFVGFLVLVRILSMGWAFLRLYGFTLTRSGGDLRAECGLFTRRVTTVPLRRIQSLTIREGPMHRLLRSVSVRIDTAGTVAAGEGAGEAATGRRLLAPIVRKSLLPGLLREVLPAADVPATAWERVHPGAHRRALKSSLRFAVGLPLTLVLTAGAWVLVPMALLVPWAFLHAWQYVKHLRYAVTAEAVLFRTGWLWRHVLVVPCAKIQVVALHESPFDRRHEMASMRVDTAGAGQASARLRIPYLDGALARKMLAYLSERSSETALERGKPYVDPSRSGNGVS